MKKAERSWSWDQEALSNLKPSRLPVPTAQAPRCSTQRAGIASPHAEGDELSGVTSDGELCAFISVPTSFVGGMPLTRARNPWAMPEPSTQRPQISPCALIPLSDVKVDPG